jgi:hypothetical protein
MTSLVLGDLILESSTPNVNARTLSGFLPNLMIFHLSWSWTLTMGRVGSNLMTWTGSDIYIYNYGFSKIRKSNNYLNGLQLVLAGSLMRTTTNSFWGFLKKKQKLTLVSYWFLFFILFILFLFLIIIFINLIYIKKLEPRILVWFWNIYI